MSLINCKIELLLKWIENCVLTSAAMVQMLMLLAQIVQLLK